MKSFVHIVFRDPHRLALFLALVFGAAAAILTYRSTDPPTPPLRRTVMAILRFIAIAGVVFMLADPILVAQRVEEIVPSVALLVDDSKSMSLTDRLGSRSAITKDLLSSKPLGELGARYRVFRFLFAESLYSWREPAFSGAATALGDALSELLDTACACDIGAAIVLSDGQSNTGADPVAVAASCPFPIYTVGIGDPNPAPDVAVAQIVTNKITYANEPTPIIAHIRAWRVGGRKGIVSLWEGSKKLSEARVELPQAGQTVPVKFTVTPDAPGIHYYTVRVPKLEGEISSANNAQSVAIKVLPSRKRVLLACDHPSWEVAFWRRAIASDPHISLEVFVSKGGGDAKLSRFPKDTAALMRYDAVVLIHSTPMLTPDAASAIADYVRQGGSLLLLLDDRKLPQTILETLSQVLPVNFPQGGAFVADEFAPVVSPEGFVHPVMRVTSPGEDLADAISGMPPFAGYVPSEAKPESKVLLAHPENNYPVLAVADLGAGRSAVICAAPTWKWAFLPFGFGGDDHIFKKLVANLMQYLLAKERISRFVLRAGKRVYRSGEPILISATLRNESNEPLSGAQISVEVQKEGGDSTERFALEMTEVGAGIYEVRLPSLAPGKYVISGGASHMGKRIGSAKTSIVVEEFELEFAQTNQDKVTLEAIAEASGGRYLSAQGIDSLPDVVKLSPRLRSERTEKELWSSPWIMAAVVLALAAEWFLRKRANLL